jgi:hypothetical protein
VERICPLLALPDDHRTVVDGYDLEHICLALDPPGALERTRQVQLCLSESHIRCERLVAMRGRPGPTRGTVGVPPDLAFASTRLILEPEPAWRTLAGAGSRRRRRLAVMGGLGLAAAVTVAAGSAAGLFGGAIPSPGAGPGTPSPSVGTSAGASVLPSATPVSSATPVPTASSSATGAPPSSIAPSSRTYVVQSGDTLGLIAARFGTTADAIRTKNGLTTDDINVGQVLIIP